MSNLESNITMILEGSQFTINLVMGDWAIDGHGQTETVTISSNLPKDALIQAYEAGEVKADVKFQKEVASVYEDNFISCRIVNKLAEHGFNIKEFSEDISPSERGYILADSYHLVWLWIAKLGNPNFDYELVNISKINIGGYGLFSP